MQSLWDSTGEKLIAEMDEAKIDCAAVFGLDLALALGETAVSIEQQNKEISKIAGRFPKRLIFFVSVDPRRKNAIDILKRGIEEWGAKGVKMHPAAGFFPEDLAFYPIYEKISDWNVPILVHTGMILPPLRHKFTKPIHLDGVLVDFPRINIIAAHLGSCWWEELAFMATRRPNLFMEISSWQQLGRQNPLQFMKILRRVMDIASHESVLFGTDSPAYRGLPMIQSKEWVEFISELPANQQIAFRQEEVDAILGGNAALLLDIG